MRVVTAGTRGLLATIALTLYAGAPALANDFDELLKDRRVIAIEGYGMRCAVIYNAKGGMGSAGSASVSCVPGWGYGGAWRPVAPTNKTRRPLAGN